MGKHVHSVVLPLVNGSLKPEKLRNAAGELFSLRGGGWEVELFFFACKIAKRI